MEEKKNNQQLQAFWLCNKTSRTIIFGQILKNIEKKHDVFLV